MLVATVRDPSPYVNMHNVTCHAGSYALQWHQQNSLNANYTVKDASAYRPLCVGYALGSSREASTDHIKEHRIKPKQPGQHLVMDAYSHNVASMSRCGRNFCKK